MLHANTQLLQSLAFHLFSFGGLEGELTAAAQLAWIDYLNVKVVDRRPSSLRVVAELELWQQLVRLDASCHQLPTQDLGMILLQKGNEQRMALTDRRPTDNYKMAIHLQGIFFPVQDCQLSILKPDSEECLNVIDLIEVECA